MPPKEASRTRTLVLGTLAALALLAALYSILGVVMNLEFTLATEQSGYARAALLWMLAAVISISGAIGFAHAAWKRR